MKRIFLLFVFCGVVFAGNAIVPSKVPYISDANNFLNYSEGMIIIPDFSISEIAKKTKEDKIFKVLTKDLIKYNLRPGTVIQSVDFETGEKKPDFILRDYVYGILPSDQQDYDRLRVIASYDSRIINSIKEIKYFSAYATGFSYVGTERKLKSLKRSTIKPETVSKIDVNIAGWSVNKHGAKLKMLNLLNGNLYVYEEEAEGETSKLVFKNSAGIYQLGATDYFSIDGSKILEWGNLKLIWVKRLTSDDCTELYLLSDNKVEVAPLSCRINL